MDINTSSTFTIRWLAGFIEGEGSFICKYLGVKISIALTDLDVLETVQKNFGGTIYEVKRRQEHYKDTWVWVINGEKAYDLTRRLLPYLHSRRKIQALKLIDKYENAHRTLIRKAKRERIPIILDLRSKGLFHREIAEKLGVDRTTVSHVLRKHGV